MVNSCLCDIKLNFLKMFGQLGQLLGIQPKVASRQVIKSKVHVVAGNKIGLSFTQ
jgi:hypothetical protein